jgi:hypothetical protein
MLARARPAVRIWLALGVWLALSLAGVARPSYAAASLEGDERAQVEAGSRLVRSAPIRIETARDQQLLLLGCLPGPTHALTGARAAGIADAPRAVDSRPISRTTCPVAARAPPRC